MSFHDRVDDCLDVKVAGSGGTSIIGSEIGVEGGESSAETEDEVFRVEVIAREEGDVGVPKSLENARLSYIQLVNNQYTLRKAGDDKGIIPFIAGEYHSGGQAPQEDDL